MSILKNLSTSFVIESSERGSTKEEIDRLIKFSDIEIPLEFVELIQDLTEIEMNVKNEFYLRIWSAEGCVEFNEAYNIQQYIPKSLAIGDDGGGRTLIYSTGSNGFGLYLVGFGALDSDELIYISSSLNDLLVNDIGVNVIAD